MLWTRSLKQSIGGETPSGPELWLAATQASLLVWHRIFVHLHLHPPHQQILSINHIIWSIIPVTQVVDETSFDPSLPLFFSYPSLLLSLSSYTELLTNQIATTAKLVFSFTGTKRERLNYHSLSLQLSASLRVTRSVSLDN